MKRILALLLATALLFSLCACGSGGEEGTEKQEVSVNLPDSGKKAPSEEMITEDVRNALAAKNQYASLVGLETVKSLTNEGSYLLTLTITAETKYADWTYEADLSYTKYDQGWMLDDLDWGAEAYHLSRLPNEDEISGQILGILEKYKWNVGAEQKYMAIRYLEASMDSALDSEQIKARFYVDRQCLHGTISDICYALWKYNAQSDNWKPAVEDDGDIIVNMQQAPTIITADPSGDWGTMIISAFSADGFEAEWNGKQEYFTYESTNYKQNRCLKFVSSSGTDAIIYLSYDWIEIAIGNLSDGNYQVDAYVMIKDSLPSLS